MSRVYNRTTIDILAFLSEKSHQVKLKELQTAAGGKLSTKDFYNYLFRLNEQELIEKSGGSVGITEEGVKLLKRLRPEKDGVWKLVIFDIPEKHKYVRTVLRAKLKQLHFKKWQNSIWISPYELDAEIQKELSELGKKFFVRLIKTTEINNTSDLEKLF